MDFGLLKWILIVGIFTSLLITPLCLCAGDHQSGFVGSGLNKDAKKDSAAVAGEKKGSANAEDLTGNKAKGVNQKAKTGAVHWQGDEKKTKIKSNGRHHSEESNTAEESDTDRIRGEDSSGEEVPQNAESAEDQPSEAIPDSVDVEKKPAVEDSIETITQKERSKGVESGDDRQTIVEPLYVEAFTDITPGHNDSNPIWSPSGQMMAFERSIGDKREIIIARADGAVVQKIYCRLSNGDDDMQFFLPGIIDDVSYNSGLSWSPVESSLVFMSNGGSGNYDLYLLPALGDESTIRLTEHTEKDSHPHWSPVDNRLVFVSGRTGSAEIYLMDLDTREVTKLTQGHKTYLYPQWSPNGKKVLMIYGSNENHDVYLIEDINRPAETLKALTNWRYDDLRPVWSPDGTKIAFYSNYNPEGNPKLWSIVVINAEGSNPTEDEKLAEKIVAVNVVPDVERGPAWMSDSKRIVYVKDDQKSYNPIYIVDIEEKTNFPIRTGTKMNHDVVCSSNGIIAFRAQVEQWDHIYIAKLKE
ncbi:MAG: PD40 domain-containing protein [Deltaproteobacteria bacterium]|nr:MAG: PD40 domain-containing protein [Deltaproteobacteria bacterium]